MSLTVFLLVVGVACCHDRLLAKHAARVNNVDFKLGHKKCEDASKCITYSVLTLYAVNSVNGAVIGSQDVCISGSRTVCSTTCVLCGVLWV